jgi:glutamate---cysteine ligase / carboxylate-amine ligase
MDEARAMAAVPETRYRLFEAFGVEIEYMIADAATLHVAPVADHLLSTEGDELIVGDVAWSNELVLHVLEMKTPFGPAPSLDGLIEHFDAGVREANARLASEGALLLPGGMHPTFDPLTETRLWPHEYGEVYRKFHRIFDSRGHGWSNLQSTHLNLPFGDDAEFGRLHAAIRFVLPLLPALAASSPLVEGRVSPWLDARMALYRENARRVPSVTGRVVPEPVASEQEYRDRILAPIYRDLEPHDPDGILRHEWVNARGAIARFERGAIEIRVLDTQECPEADLAILAATARVVRALCDEETATVRDLDAFETDRLAAILEETITTADAARIHDEEYLRRLGMRADSPVTAASIWARLLDRFPPEGADSPRWAGALDNILTGGSLARRMLRRLGPEPGPAAIQAVWRELAMCLAHGRQLDVLEDHPGRLAG